MAIKELYIDSVQFSYDKFNQIITGVYLKCHTGDIIALFGRNGSGKSTLLKIIFGSLRAESSHILVNGIKTQKAYLTGKVGYLPQDSFLPSHERVLKLVDLLIGDQRLKNNFLSDARIGHLKDKKVHQLSGGERRYLEIWLLICQPTDFLLLDEPFTGIEPMYITFISELIQRFSDKKGFIISDHHYHELLNISTQIVLLQNGSCLQIKDKKELEFFYLPYGTFDS